MSLYNPVSQKKYREKNRKRYSEASKEYFKNNKEAIYKYREENKEDVSKCQKIAKKKAKDNLEDSYIKGLLTHGSILTAKDIPEDLIELTRTRLLIKRGLEDVKKNNENN